MNVSAAAAAIGVAVVMLVVCARRALVVGPPTLPAVYRRLYGVQVASPPVSRSGLDRLFAVWGRRLAGTAAGERFELRRRFPLRAAGVGVAALAARTMAVTLVAFVLTAAVSAGGWLAGSELPVIVSVAAPFVVAGFVGWWQVQSVLTAAQRRYRQFRAGVAAYIQLVAVCMTTRRSMPEAVAYAAEVGSGAAFETIAAAVRAAPQTGVRVWEALDAVGEQYGCRELQDLASSVAHVARIGVGVESTVTAVATRMRQVALDDMQRAADRQTSTMFGPTMLFVLGTVAFLAYPLAVRVLEAFATTT